MVCTRDWLATGDVTNTPQATIDTFTVKGLKLPKHSLDEGGYSRP